MDARSEDIIVARATPPGQGGVGIIRISGQAIDNIINSILGTIPKPRYATYCQFRQSDGSTLDEGVAVYFKAPYSFTGEDVLELQGHGGTVVMDMLLQRILALGVRLARPGEFTLRAFLNDKIDLTQAEAIADLIAASSEQAARSAIHSLQGKFSDEVNHLVDKIIQLRMYVEAAIDFPEEEIDFLSDGNILHKLEAIMERLEQVLDRARQGRALKEGMKVVIAGYPNAGKSSLLNLLSGDNSAIVSDIPGTTRDVIKETILIDGVPLFLVDTAGLRPADNVIEAEGVRRAWQEIPNADRILLVLEATQCPIENIIHHPLVQELSHYHDRVTVLRNKIDLTRESASCQTGVDSQVTIINLSAKTGCGLEELKQHLKKSAGYHGDENVFIARRRHIDALHITKQHLQDALEQLLVYKAGELVAEELRVAQQALGEITGEFRSDDLLGNIFSSFCIGK
jgi:tRNA modification GTPase